MENKCTCERPDDNTCEYCEKQQEESILAEAKNNMEIRNEAKQKAQELGCSYPDCICQGDEILYCNNRKENNDDKDNN